MLTNKWCTPAADLPGWREWRIGAEGQFNRHMFDRLLSRLDDPETARIRVVPGPSHANINNVIHGGAIMALIDMAIYPAAMEITGNHALKVVSVDIHTQFIGPGDLARPLDCVVQLAKETGKMMFTRGTLEQGDEVVASFNALQRKIR